jgi:hypothetical protein
LQSAEDCGAPRRRFYENTVKKGLKRSAIFLAACVVLVGVPALAFYLRFTPRIPMPDFPAARNIAEANQQDVQYLRDTFPVTDRSLTPAMRPQFDEEIDALKSRAADLSRGELAVGVAHAVALSDNGHTELSTTRLRHIDLRFFWFAEGLFVLQTSAENSDLLGFRVDKIGSRVPAEIYSKVRPLIPGREEYKRVRSIHFLDSPDALEGLHVIPLSDAVSMELIAPGGERVSRIFKVSSRQIPSEGEVDPRFKNGPGCDVTCDWPQLLDRGTQPLYVQQAPDGYFRTWLEDIDALYVRVFAIADVGKQPIARFFADTVAEASRRRPRHVIVDLRGDGGGNYLLARSFAKQIDSLVPGEVFIVTDGGTFSAALVTVAFLKYFAHGRAQIVGQHVGDSEQFWAEDSAIVLPNSKLRVWTATGYHDWEHGCSDWSKCFWLNIVLGVSAGKLDVDLPAPSTFAAYQSGRDESLERIRLFLSMQH